MLECAPELNQVADNAPASVLSAHALKPVCHAGSLLKGHTYWLQDDKYVHDLSSSRACGGSNAAVVKLSTPPCPMRSLGSPT